MSKRFYVDNESRFEYFVNNDLNKANNLKKLLITIKIFFKLDPF